MAACARGIQPRFYGFLKDVHISQNQTKYCFSLHLLRSLMKNQYWRDRTLFLVGAAGPPTCLSTCLLSTGQMVCYFGGFFGLGHYNTSTIVILMQFTRYELTYEAKHLRRRSKYVQGDRSLRNKCRAGLNKGKGVQLGWPGRILPCE